MSSLLSFFLDSFNFCSKIDIIYFLLVLMKKGGGVGFHGWICDVHVLYDVHIFMKGCFYDFWKG